MSLAQIVAAIPTEWIEQYVHVFEAGRVQRHPQARFVNGAGECCVVGALAGARSSAELVASPVYAGFVGGVLEELSRRFETGRLSGQSFYEEALLALAARRPATTRVAVAGETVVAI
jgi:hypothetical protein